MKRKFLEVDQFYRVTSQLLQKQPLEGVHRRCSVEKDVLKNFANFTAKYLCWSLRPSGLQLFEKETPAQVLFCEIFGI